MSETKLNNSDINYNTTVPWSAVDTSTFPEATETTKWVVTKASDAEVTTWTENTKFVTAKAVKDNYWIITSPIAWSNFLWVWTNVVNSTNSTTKTYSKNITVNYKWTYRISTTLYNDNSGWSAKLKVNWSDVATDSVTNWSVTIKSDELLEVWDIITVEFTWNDNYTTEIRWLSMTYNLNVWILN